MYYDLFTYTSKTFEIFITFEISHVSTRLIYVVYAPSWRLAPRKSLHAPVLARMRSDKKDIYSSTTTTTIIITYLLFFDPIPRLNNNTSSKTDYTNIVNTIVFTPYVIFSTSHESKGGERFASSTNSLLIRINLLYDFESGTYK